MLLKGVSVQDNCIIGACALVTKGFDETNVIISGVPAKVIKKETNWCSERISVN